MLYIVCIVMTQLTGVNKMSEIKTVTHEGKVYQIGKVYSFSQDRKYKCERRLKGVEKSSAGYPIVDHAGVCWRYIEVINSSELGTITPAPIELINGAAYMFDVRENTFLGFYRERRKSFFYEIINGNKIAGASEATNIRLMTVESK
jgi:hypothetical protein